MVYPGKNCGNHYARYVDNVSYFTYSIFETSSNMEGLTRVKVLVVSEYKTRFKWIEGHLSRSTYEVLWVQNVDGAQDQLQLCPAPQAIVSDTHLRVASGLHVLQMIWRLQKKSLPTLIMSERDTFRHPDFADLGEIQLANYVRTNFGSFATFQLRHSDDADIITINDWLQSLSIPTNAS